MENVPNMQNQTGIRRELAAIGSSTAIAALMYLPFLVNDRLGFAFKPHWDRVYVAESGWNSSFSTACGLLRLLAEELLWIQFLLR